MQVALGRATAAPGDLDSRIHQAKQDLLELDSGLNGLGSKRQPGEKTRPTVGNRLSAVERGVGNSTYGPTATHEQQLQIAHNQLTGYRTTLEELLERLSGLSRDLIAAGAPWIEGDALPWGDNR